jgi:biopolymer transport protein ExbD
MALDVQNDVLEEEPELNTTINTTPLVDVMLVLLVVFLVTIPVFIRTVPVHLPNARNIVTLTKPENIVIAVDKDENVYYNNAPIEVSELKGRFEDALRRAQAKGMSAANMPEVHIRGDRNVRFEAVGRVIFAAQQAGILKVGFLTEPHNGG